MENRTGLPGLGDDGLVPLSAPSFLAAVLFWLAGCSTTPEPTAPVVDRAAAPVEAQPTRPSAEWTAGPAPAAERPVVRALRILRRWDRSRAAAYASGDVAALRRLYAPASVAGAADVRLLREYADRGLVVRGLAVQVVRAELVASSPTRLRLRVVERLAGGTVVGPGPDVALPAGRAAPRVVTLVDAGGRWVVRAVRRGCSNRSQPGTSPGQRSAAESRSAMSLCANA